MEHITRFCIHLPFKGLKAYPYEATSNNLTRLCEATQEKFIIFYLQLSPKQSKK